MKFSNASAVEQVCSQMLLADYPRAANRARINDLFNGAPVYSDQEVRDNNIATNTNFLDATNISHHGRGQFYTAFCNPDPLFTVEVDYGPQWKRREWGSRIGKEMNKIIKQSRTYFEVRQSTFASLVLHGIGPCQWQDKEHWCPDDLGVEDVLLPSNTYRSMKGLPLHCVRRSYTVPQLQKMTRGRNVDPAWNMDLVKQTIKWADKEAQALLGTNWIDTWSPEKQSERVKGDGGWYASDAVPTIDVFDFYFWSDEKGSSGWKRRMILDAWGDPGAGGLSAESAESSLTRKNDVGKGEFLYNSEDRIYADSIDKIIHFNFADCSSVAPFRYHAIRSLGFLLYGVCHLQNRLRCKFNDAVFESLLQYFRVSNPADMDRLMKINLVDKGVLEDGVQFVKPDERWQINEALVMQAMGMNRQTMQDNSASFTQDFDTDNKSDKGETATRTMAKVNSTTALVGAMLQQAYNYSTWQYYEIARRFTIKGSSDLDVNKFRVRCLKHGVPEEALNVDAWNVQPVRVIGSGNKMMASAIADKLMAIAPRLDPTAQRVVDKMYIAANSDDYDLADRLVPEGPVISTTIHDTELVYAALLGGAQVSPMPGLSPIEVCQVMLHQMQNTIQEVHQSGGVGDAKIVQGLIRASQYTAAFIKMLSQDKNEKQKVAEFSKSLSKLGNEIKGFQQRQQEAAKQAAQQNGGDPESAAKVKAAMMLAQSKVKIGQESHAQKTAQRALTFEQKAKQDAEKHKMDLQRDVMEHSVEVHKKALETTHALKMNRLKSVSSGEE